MSIHVAMQISMRKLPRLSLARSRASIGFRGANLMSESKTVARIDRKNAIAWWFLLAFAIELIVLFALAVLS